MGDSDSPYSYCNTWSSYESSIRNSHYSTMYSPEFVLIENPEHPDSPTILSVDDWLSGVFDHDPRIQIIDGIRDGERVHVVGMASPMVDCVYIKLRSESVGYISVCNKKGTEIFKGDVKDTEIFLIKWSLSV